MKKLIILPLLLLISCKAQTTYPLSNYDSSNLKNNNYIQDSEGVLNPFVGTWEWTDGLSNFRIVLTKENHWKAPNDNFYEDKIFGGYRYIENGNLIIDKLSYTTSFTSNPSTWSSFSSILGGVSYPETNKLIISIYDAVKGKDCHATITLQMNSNGIVQGHWKLQDKETSNYHGSVKQQGFSIPTDVILTKIN